MDIQAWFRLFLEQISHTSLVEWLAVGFGVSEVLLAKRNSIWLYPTGIVSILLSMFLLLNVKLYAEMLLSIYYLIMSIYGWVIWKKRKLEGENQVAWSTNNELLIAVVISVIGFFVFFFVLRNHTDSDVPLLDAFVSSTAWAGMWLLAKRKIENWIFLNISNIVAIPLLFHKKLPLMACLTIFLFVVAIFGFMDWKKIIGKRALRSV
ncbi:nicotinamide riboside transporter PnuC [Pedobacter aquatilis]|uniref:nicotinamide riboside transporter PnuC n=1 Tax=Pedobacter aquatilis TaxID=351343 RepID=UPI00292E1D14|nr:nicotinamide riboside transporter PnuC [Pedobacter aquatilis]